MTSYWTCEDDGYLFRGAGDGWEWRDIETELSMLTMEGKAEERGDGYLIPHGTAVSFSREERELLTLPAVFPYPISVKPKGLLTAADFRFEVYFENGDGSYFVNPKVIGSMIEIHEGLRFLFNAAQYDIWRAAKDCNGALSSLENTGDAKVLALSHLARIQAAAESVEAKLDGYLEQTKVVAPEHLTISVKKADDGSYTVVPVILKSDGTSYTEAEESAFAEKFRKTGVARNTYVGKDQTFYVFDKPQLEGLEEIKKKKRISLEEARQIVMTPQSVFKSETFEFNLDDYSERVTGYDTFIQKNYPYLKAIEGGWLPEEGTTSLDGDELPVISEEEIPALIEKVKEAEAKGEPAVEYGGKSYPISTIKRAIEKAKAPKAAGPTGKPPVRPLTEDKNLLTKDNISQMDFEDSSEKERQRRALSRRQALGRGFDMLARGLKEEVTPFSYQEEGIRWMTRNWKSGYRGVLLADDMGLGKTLQTLGFISSLKASYGKRPMPSVLVVAPVALLANWAMEYRRFVKYGLFKEIVTVDGAYLRGRARADSLLLDLSDLTENKIVLISYETLGKNDIHFGRVDWSVMVLDEAQKIKNPSIRLTNCVKAMKYDFGIAITGTPVENTWVDLWSIMDFVDPGRLKELKEFCQTYQNQLKHLAGDPAALSALGTELEGELSPIFLRRQKKDHLDGLPKKTIHPLPQVMPKVQREAYDKIIAFGQKEENRKGQMLKIIAALRDTSLCPHLSTYSDRAFETMEPKEFFYSSARLMMLFQTLVQIREKKEKALVFVISRKLQRLLRGFLEKVFQISIQAPINGEMNGAARQRVVDEFNGKEGFAVLILSPEAGGVGFNITAANHVIHLSRWWNPAKEDQATDRAYRIGQKKEVHVYLPMAIYQKGDGVPSFDEKLDELLEFKRRLCQSVIFPTEISEEEASEQLTRSLFVNMAAESPAAYGNKDCYSISDMDRVNGETFEYLMTRLYDSIPGYTAEQTPQRNDYGADIVVFTDGARKKGLLVQCKQTSTGNPMGPEGVAEIMSAVPHYKKTYGATFRPVVITNAPDFTQNAKVRADDGKVKLLTRTDLEKLLERYPLEKEWNW